VVEEVVMFNVVLPGTTSELFTNAALVPAGSPLTVRFTVPAKPFTADRLTVALVPLPGGAPTVDVFVAIVKSVGGAASNPYTFTASEKVAM
jgi:hypothetical protein